jgi:hypothetical protein
MLLLLAITSGNTAAEWIKVGVNSNDTYTAYVDISNMRKIDNKVKIWVLFDFKKVQIKFSNEPILSAKMQTEYDCKEVKERLIHLSQFAGNMGEGKIVLTFGAPTEWEPVAPGSTGDAVWKMVCGSS